MDEYDFFDTPITPYTVLVDGAEVELHVRDTATMEQHGVRAVVAKSMERLPDATGAKLNVYGRLGERIREDWFIHVIEDMDDAALETDHLEAQKLDIEQSLGSAEKFKESKYRKPKGQ